MLKRFRRSKRRTTWIKVAGESKRRSVKIFGISHCAPCKNTRMLLEENSIEYEYLNIDKADPEEYEEAMIELGEFLPSRGVKLAYPVVIIDELSVIIGFQKKKLESILEIK